jgi:hypothetical protein
MEAFEEHNRIVKKQLTDLDYNFYAPHFEENKPETHEYSYGPNQKHSTVVVDHAASIINHGKNHM